MEQHIPQNHRLIFPYMREIYDYGEYNYDSHSVSPNNKYIAIYLTIEEDLHSFTDPKATSSVLKLFKISNKKSDPQLIFCTDLLIFDCTIDNFSFIWSATGNKLICEHQINSAAPYKLIYFDVTDDKYDNYKVHYVFADNETYKWEHSMTFSEDDSMLVTVYNREIIRVFEYSAKTCNYHFKTEETYDSNTYTITNIYLTADNKLIVSLYNSVDMKNIVVSYQISEDKCELQYLTEDGIRASAGIQIFNSSKCTHNNNDYLVLLVTYGINYHSPSKIYIYDLTELKITETINVHLFKEDKQNAYMGYAYKMLFETIGNMKTFTDDRYLPKLCYPISDKQTNLINDKYIWVLSVPQDENCKYMFNVFTKEKIFTAYSSHEYIGIRNINGRLSSHYNQLHKTSNKVYVFTNDEQEPYKAMYNLNKLSQAIPIEDIRFVHDTPTCVICEYDNKLWYGNSIPFCEEKNTVIITNLLQEYIPVELCHLVAKYCI